MEFRKEEEYLKARTHLLSCLFDQILLAILVRNGYVVDSVKMYLLFE